MDLSGYGLEVWLTHLKEVITKSLTSSEEDFQLEEFSWVRLKGRSVEDLSAVESWASPYTFIRFYILDLTSGSVARCPRVPTGQEA